MAHRMILFRPMRAARGLECMRLFAHRPPVPRPTDALNNVQKALFAPAASVQVMPVQVSQTIIN